MDLDMHQTYRDVLTTCGTFDNTILGDVLHCLSEF